MKKTKTVDIRTLQNRPPNFRDEKGNLFLVRCFNCNSDYGRENYVMNGASGVCTWCGWKEETVTDDK